MLFWLGFERDLSGLLLGQPDGGQLPSYDPDYVSGYGVTFDPANPNHVIATTWALTSTSFGS